MSTETNEKKRGLALYTIKFHAEIDLEDGGLYPHEVQDRLQEWCADYPAGRLEINIIPEFEDEIN